MVHWRHWRSDKLREAMMQLIERLGLMKKQPCNGQVQFDKVIEFWPYQ